MKKALALTCLLFLFFSASGQTTRILLIPLDDRPPCLQFPVKMAEIGNAEVVTPPREMLGRFTIPGDPGQIISWIRKQDLSSYQAVIISLDMIAYGGLVASRVFETPVSKALERVKIVEEIRKEIPNTPLFAQSVIMRLAPTSDGKNESYREKLARWADISPYPEHAAETNQLESQIPAEALKNYLKSRERNFMLNTEAIRLVREGLADYLILSQDDAKPRGIHVSDRERLVQLISESRIGGKVIVQPGTDEIAMLLLARALNTLNKTRPAVFVKYSSDSAANTPMPFEDRPLRSTVSFNITAAGGEEKADEGKAELLFYVFTSRFEKGKAAGFAAEIAKKASAGKRVMVADVDPKGNVQGGDTTFTRELLSHKVFDKLYSYASWNTAGNTIGTALPQGLIYRMSEVKSSAGISPEKNILQANHWFTFHRLVDDYAFHTIVRPKANEYFRQSNRSGFARPDEVARQVEKYSYDLLLPLFNELGGKFKQEGDSGTVPGNLKLSLPWNRTFEAEIDFTLN